MSFEITSTPMRLLSGLEREVRVFSSTQEAVRHINRHLLSVPEGYSWSLIDPELEEQLPIEHDVARERLRRHGLQQGAPLLGAIYERYAARILCTIEEGLNSGWAIHPEGTGTMWFFSSDGILVGVEIGADTAWVRTAMIPGQSDARAVLSERHSTHSGRDVAHAERALHRRRGRPATARERRDHLRRMREWSREKRLYHVVFRPASAFIRRGQSGQARLGGTSRFGHSYFHLKQLLPTAGELEDRWRMIRANRPRRCQPPAPA